MNPEAFGAIFYIGLRLASVSAAGLAFFMGKFLLAAVLAGVAVGVWLRLWRRTRR